MVVTTSCFTAWRKSKKINECAKIIPAISAGEGSADVRVFFFDDNINLHLGGAYNVDGICNLRDVATGDFVDFSVGENGFECSRAYKHTVIHHSAEYRNVLIQANILDAMANLDYFTSIIKRFSKPGEKLVVFTDINGTVVWDDTVSGKNAAEVLLSTMFRFAEIRPKSPFEFTWEEQPTVKIDKTTGLRGVVKEISGKDNELYQNFWRFETCYAFLQELEEKCDIHWIQQEEKITVASFFARYDEYVNAIEDSTNRGNATADGVTNSWLRCYRWLNAEGHAVILNSFGVDTTRVVVQSVPDQRAVLQITVDYDIWGKSDLEAWLEQFSKPSGFGSESTKVQLERRTARKSTKMQNDTAG